MGTQQFCLRWNNHQLNMLNVFESLLQNEVLVDVTLACDGFTMKAHKVVLSACSPYFQSLFMENPCKHPIVILKDVRYRDLKALIDFMYKGEVNVGQDQLNGLLNTAEALKIKGLAEVTGGGASCTNATLEPHVPPHLIGRLQKSGNGGGGSGGSSGSASCPQSCSPPPSQGHLPAHHPPPPALLDVTSGKLGLVGSQHALSNSSGVRYGASAASPPPKRRKTKPRKRMPESAMISSDQEDSDALDLATTTPEMIETCVDLLPTENTAMSEMSGDAKSPPELPPAPPPPPLPDVKPMPVLELVTQPPNQSHHHHHQHLHSQYGLDSANPDDHPSPIADNKFFTSSVNQNQFSSAAPSPLPPTQRLGPVLPKPPLLSVLPPASSSPVPSTSTTEATLQDIRRMCHFTRQSQKHKSPWTEDDMVLALEAVQCGRLTYALAARKFDIPKATLHYYVILMKAVEAVRSGRMTPEIAAIKYNVRASILIGCLCGGTTEPSSRSGGASPPPPQLATSLVTERNDVVKREP